MQINVRIINIILLASAGVLLFWFGRLSLQYELAKQVPPIRVVPEINQKVPLVEITAIENAMLKGNVNKNGIRIKAGDAVAVLEEDLTFQLDIRSLGFTARKQPEDPAKVPEWAKFVASKRGKYFYVLDSRSAKNLSVENRVFFATEEEAKKAGYEKRER
jgi:hypothetical protein